MDHNERDAFKIYLILAKFYNKISSKYLLYAISCELQILKTFQCAFLRNIIHCIFLRYFTTCISQIFQCVFLRSALACVAHMFRGWHWAAKVG